MTPEQRRAALELLADLVAMTKAIEADQHKVHSHKCTNRACNHIWRHTGANAGNEAAHMCPKCGAGPQWARHFD